MPVYAATKVMLSKENSPTWLHRSRFCAHVFRPFELNSDGFNGVFFTKRFKA